VLVLTGDGRMAYSGSSRELEAHFGALGYTPRGAHEHVLDRVLDALVNGSEGVIDSVVAAQAASGALQADYEALCCGEEPALVARSALAGGVRRLPRSRARVTRRFALLFLRAAVDAVRDPFHIVLNYGAAAAAALGLGLLYRDAGYETAGMQDRLGAFFFLLVFVSLLTMGSVPSWHGSRRVFLHERASSVYGTTEYLAAGLLVDIVLLRVLPSWFFVALMYRPMGLSDDPGHLATFAAILILANATASVVCMAVTCAMASARSANLVMSNVFIVLFMFGGFLLNKDTLPPLVRWLGHVSFVNYAFELLAINEFHGTPAMWTFTVPNTTEPGDKPLPPLTVDGDSVLRQFGMYPQRWTLDFWLLGAIVAACVLLAYAQLLLARDGELELSLSLLAWFRPVAKNGGTKNLRGADSVDALTNAAREVESDGADADDEMETPLLASAESPRAFHRGAFSVTIDSGSSANHLSWTGLDYSVQTVRGWRNVLCGVSGVAAHTAADSSGVCAVLGPSGAGKTTLLDILSGRLCGSAVGGEVRVNGCLAGPAALRSVSGYVPQQDVLPATSTVLEYLLFHAALRLPRCVDRAQRERRVWAILSRLGLQRIARSTIGSVEHRGLSGGERRRVSIAVELLSQPGLLFLDEPTSGLDSSNSRRVLDILCALGSGGVTCVLSIHQPRADAFRAFDRVLVLTGDGRMAYSGSSRELEAHFGALGYTPRGAHEHVIDRVLDALVSGSPGEVEAIATHAAGDFERSVEGKASFRLRESSTDAIAGPEPLLPEGQGARFRAAFGTQLRLLLWRAVNNTLRNPLLLLVNFVVSFIMALVIGLTFQRAGIDSPGIQNRFGCIFFVALYFSLMSLSSLPVWREERQLFAHERAAGCYGTVPYFLSSVLADTLILRLVPPLFFTLSAHFLVDLLPTGVRVAHFTLIVALLNTAAAACGMAIGAACNSAAVANVAGALWILANVLFGGLVLSEREAPEVVKALSHLSYFRYGYESLLINEFHDTEGWHFSSYKAPTELYKVVSGDTILRTFGFDPNGMEGDLVGLAVLLGVAWAITLALLRLRAGSVS
jgi:ATP-binding cassette subfamily G (WHITE) protein 2